MRHGTDQGRNVLKLDQGSVADGRSVLYRAHLSQIVSSIAEHPLKVEGEHARPVLIVIQPNGPPHDLGPPSHDRLIALVAAH